MGQTAFLFLGAGGQYNCLHFSKLDPFSRRLEAIIYGSNKTPSHVSRG